MYCETTSSTKDINIEDYCGKCRRKYNTHFIIRHSYSMYNMCLSLASCGHVELEFALFHVDRFYFSQKMLGS